MSLSAAAEPDFDPRLVARIASALVESQPSAGETRVLAIDGRSGAGKSTLADLVARATGASIVALEYLYGGWDDLFGGVARLRESVLEPFARSETALVPRFDWVAGDWAEPATIEPPGLLIVEGVGAFSPSPAELVGVGVWLDAPEAVRRRRTDLRDGGAFADYWDSWAAQEERLLALGHPADRAHLTVECG